MRDTGWFKSTFSSGGSDSCVEVRLTGDAAWLRDSKNPDPTLDVDLAALVAVVKAGRLNR